MAQPESDRPGSIYRIAEAYRALTTGLLDQAHKEAFSLEAENPERAIYEALFTSTATQRTNPVGEGAGLTPPSRSNWRAAWTHMIDGFDRATDTRVNLTQIASVCTAESVAADSGMICLLLVAGLLTRREDVVLYEHQNLVSVLTPAVVGRMFENIDAFSVKNTQSCEGKRRALLDILTRRLQLPESAGGSRLLQITIALYQRLQAMPPYTQQTTQSLSRDTLAIRQCFRGASEPDVLIFETLPIIMMIEEFSGPAPLNRVAAGEYTTGLFKAIRELDAAYPALLKGVQQALSDAVSSEAGSLRGLRQDLAARAETATRHELNSALEDEFVSALRGPGSDEQWLERIASISTKGTSPQEWSDDMIDLFRVQIGHLGSVFCQEFPPA